MADAAGIAHVNAGQQMIGGSRVIQHWNLPNAKNGAKTALREGKVDVLTLSPNTMLPDPGIDQFTRLGIERNSTLRVLVQASWPTHDGTLDKAFAKQTRNAAPSRVSALSATPLSSAILPIPIHRSPMKSIVRRFLCLLAAPLFAQAPYPPNFNDARVETYRKIDSTELKLWIFGESDPGAQKPAIVFFFGYGWNSGSPAQFERQARHFAKRGMIAITADYRVKSRHGVQVVECVKDAKAAIAWVRENARRLGIDPNKIAASGGSAGGHLAASTGTINGFGSDERPNAMILFNPAAALAPIAGWEARGTELALGLERLGVPAQTISPAHHIGPQTPPTLVLHGKTDTIVPYASVVAFESAMKAAGRSCTLIGYEDAGHGFFNTVQYFAKTLAESDRFLVDLGWINNSK